MVEVSNLTGSALDWAVAKANELFDADIKIGKATSKAAVLDGPHGVVDMRTGAYFRPSTNWSQGGPIIEREKMDIEWRSIEGCRAKLEWLDEPFHEGFGPTPLIAAMRCYVASKLGDEIKIPKELLND